MSGDFGTSLANAWQHLLAFVSQIVSPDWGALVKLLPLAVAPIVGLFLLVAILRWGAFGLRRPRARVRYLDGPSPLPRDASGNAAPPAGMPYSSGTGLVYPPGATRADDGRELAIICPMCGIERPAQLRACGNCGLILEISPRIQVARPAGPPPGGAAAA